VPRVALGLVVEGAYDTAVFGELIPRILGGEVQISRVIETGGSGRLMARVPGYVKLETLRRRCPNFRAFEEKVRE